MLESYIRTGDGKDYVDVDCVREALGIKEDEDIFLAIKKLKEERGRYKSNCDYFAGIAEDKLCDRNKLELELREALGIVDEYADIPGLVRKLREERDQLKDRVRRLRIQANSIYGASCGYSEYTGDKAPAFLCNVISYSWGFGALGTPFSSQSIRVELKLTPTANYKGTFDLEELKKYIQAYGREKKLGIVESVDYQNAKAARAELAYLYKTVLDKEKLDRDLSPHEIMKAILDEYDKREDFIRELSCSLGFGNPVVKPDNIDQKEKDILERIESLKSGVWPCENTSTFAMYLRNEFPKFCERYNIVPLTDASIHDWLQYIFDILSEWRGKYDSEWNRAEELIKGKRAAEDSLAELRAKIREIYRSVVDDEWDGHLSYTSAMNNINEEYKRVVHNFEERTADWHKTQQDLDRYKLAVGSLLDIPKGSRDDINAIERSFNLTSKKYASLKEFRNDVCEILDIPSSMADDQEQILKEIHDFADRYYELRDFRADICEVLGIDADELFGSPQQNDKYILEQVEKLKETNGDTKLFKRDIRKALCVYGEASYPEIVAKAREVFDRRNELIYFKGDVAKAAGLGREAEEYIILESVKALKGYSDAVEQGADKAIYAVDKDEYDKQKELADRLARLRSNICTDLCLGGETCDEDILKRVRMTRDCHDALCKDYTELRKAIWEAMDRKPETLPDETSRLVGEVTELARGEKLLIEFRDAVAEAIGITYPTTNQFIVSRVADIYKERGEAHDLAMELDRKCIDLTAKNSDLQQKFQFQSGLRQQWHSRYESEHERANCVQKALDREREKSRVKDISLETAKKQYEKICGNLETAECAINGMKSKLRSLQEEKTKVISALGQDIWDDCLKK